MYISLAFTALLASHLGSAAIAQLEVGDNDFILERNAVSALENDSQMLTRRMAPYIIPTAPGVYMPPTPEHHPHKKHSGKKHHGQGKKHSGKGNHKHGRKYHGVRHGHHGYNHLGHGRHRHAGSRHGHTKHPGPEHGRYKKHPGSRHGQQKHRGGNIPKHPGRGHPKRPQHHSGEDRKPAPQPKPADQKPVQPPPADPRPSNPGNSKPRGQTYTGDITYYTPGLGSCGNTNTESDMIVALAANMMGIAANPNLNPNCGKSITISHGGNTAQATIQDTCPGCSGAGLDLTPALFQEFGSLGEGRISGVQWWFN